ncbi:hypothetical protein NECAME_08589 [Necator americanus]|uniref:Uncharacterized protein n=1 Tax=Necator americanus TaxID=51031 RepID=W2TJF6_NECAM|nr:hypothetical protein NECAME_08589 [Necator americanus]ETN81281.1 hypothetical protein NECAME_08589 [Necator americanus]
MAGADHGPCAGRRAGGGGRAETQRNQLRARSLQQICPSWDVIGELQWYVPCCALILPIFLPVSPFYKDADVDGHRLNDHTMASYCPIGYC